LVDTPVDRVSFEDQPWRVEYVISEGPISDVYRVSVPDSDEKYVLKWFHTDVFEEEVDVRAAESSLKDWKSLSQGRAFGIQDYGREEGRLWVLVPFYEGIILEEWLADETETGAANTDEIADLFKRLVGRLKEFYKVSHRDYFGNLRPTNAFIGRDGELSLSDGWLVDILPPEQIQTYFEDSDFLAPEIKAHGEGQEYSDVYSLGQLLKIAIAGDLSDIRTESALAGYDFDEKHFVRLIAKATAVEPEQRYPTVERFHQELAALFSEEEIIDEQAVREPEASDSTGVFEDLGSKTGDVLLAPLLAGWEAMGEFDTGDAYRWGLFLGVLLVAFVGTWLYLTGSDRARVADEVSQAYAKLETASADAYQRGVKAVDEHQKARKEETAKAATNQVRSGLQNAENETREDNSDDSGGRAGIGEPSGREPEEPSGTPEPQDQQRQKEDKGPIECPDDMVRVGGQGDYFCIDAYEYPGKGQKPLRDVTWFEAKNRCEAEGKDLCSLSQWRSACGAKYSYGNRWNPDRCNTANDKGFARSVSASGALPACRSPVGAYDMVGNVFEWVRGQKVVGGSFENGPEMATCRYASRKAPGSTAPNIGFRCCKTR
jgi:hypothetical protein